MQNIKERQEFENYNKIKLLGEGSFGKAFLVERASDKLKCVMKQIDIGKMSESEKKETVKEAKILEVLSHPNIVKFIEVFKTKNGKLCIVMDFADGGDLQNRVKEQRGRMFSESQVLEWFTQICLGLKHIHDRKILHRDLKGQNIFLTKQGIVKIGDFGIAKVLASTMQNARTVVGTPYYLSPEIVQSKPYNFKSDMWSLGVVLYELCAQKPPFDAPSLHFLAMKIVRGAYNPLPSSFSSELKQLTSQMLNTNEKMRPDINKVLSANIIQNRIKSYLSETIYQKEFSHTILHKQDVFNPKFKQIQNMPNQVAQSKSPVPGAVAQQQQRPEPVGYKSPIGLPTPPQANNQQAVPRYNPAGARPQTAQPPVAAPQQRAQVNPPVMQQRNAQQSPGMAAYLAGNQSPKNNQVRPPQQQYGAPQQAAAPKLNYHYQQQQAAQQALPQPIQKPLSALPQPDPRAAQAQAQAQAEVQAAREKAAKLNEMARAQQDAIVVAQAKRLEEEKRAKERMQEIDARLKQKEAELKKIDDLKKEREQKEKQRRQQEEEEQRLRKQKEDQQKKNEEIARREKEQRDQQKRYADEEIAKLKRQQEREEEEKKRKLQREEQTRKLQEAEQARIEQANRLKREEVQRKQEEEYKKKELQKMAEVNAIKDRIEKQVQKQVKPVQEGTDINMFLKNALNNVNNNIQNVEKKIGAPSPLKDQVSPRMPPIQSARQQDIPAQEPVKARVQPPQSAKQREPIQGAPKVHQPPQSARQAHSQQDWMKKASDSKNKKEIVAEKPKKSEEENSAEKEKRDQERKKQRDEAMKQWREKWQNKQGKDCVVTSADIPRDEKPVGPKIIERIKPKAVVKSCADWKAKDENAINEQLTKVTPTKMGGMVDRKNEPMKDILKENSPQPLRVNHMQVQQDLDSVPLKQSLPKKCKSPPVVSHPKVLIEEVKQEPVQQMIIQEDEEEEPENDIYKMLREMASLVRKDQHTPEGEEEEEDKNSGSSDSDDDGFDNQDRDFGWAGASQRKKSPFKGSSDPNPNHEPVIINNRRISLDPPMTMIPEAQSDAENTFANSRQRPATPGNGQDAPAIRESSDSEDRDDPVEDESTDITSSQNSDNQNFTFMKNDPNNVAVLEQISKFSSVEEYRDFLEKELGEDKLMKAYPLLKEFGDNILFYEKTQELEKILSQVLSIQEIRKYQPHFATWIFMELQAESADGLGGRVGLVSAMKTLKNINMTTAQFGKFI